MAFENSEPSFALLLSAARASVDLTQEKLAELGETAVRVIQDWEGGKVRAPRASVFNPVIAALRKRGVSEELLNRLVETVRTAREQQRQGRRRARSGAERSNEPANGGDAIVGRESDSEAILKLLRECRLVTLTGPPGVGKSRLARHIGDLVGQQFPDGMAFVEMDGVAGPSLVASRITAVLRIAEADATVQSAADALIAYLRERHMLLMLDDFEHLVEASDLLHRILEETQTAILVTSRRRLRLTKECEYKVPPLDTDASVGVSDAATLFNRRVDQLRKTHNFDGAEVDELCGLLDGLPLAIELAAARTRYIGPKALARAIRDGLDSLGESAPDEPERHRTMRATLEWSYGLLSEPAKTTLRALSIFEAPVTFDSLSRLAAPTDTSDVLASLVELLDCSLVRYIDDAEPERYTMLTVIRQFARDKLDEVDEAGAVAFVHANICAAAAASIRQNASALGGYDANLAAYVEGWLADIWAAGRWLARHRQDRAAGLALLVADYCDLRGRYTEALEAYDLVISCGLLTEGYRGATAVLRHQGRLKEALLRAQAGLQATPESLARDRAVLLVQQGWTLTLLPRRLDEASVALNRALDDADGVTRSLALAQLARVESIRENYPRSLEFAAAAVARAETSAYSRVTVLRLLGDAYRSAGDPTTARAVLTEALDLARRFSNAEEIGGCLLNLALAERDLAGTDGQMFELAIAHDREATSLFEQISHGSGRVTAYSNLAEVLGRVRQLTEAVKRATDAISLAQSIGYELGEADSLDTLGFVYANNGEPCLAVDYLRRAADMFVDLDLVGAARHAREGAFEADSECNQVNP